MQAIVSVIIPCYNASRWLLPAMASVLANRGPQLEVIVVNDGSTDGSTKLLHSVASQDRRITVVDLHSNTGIVNALNHALDLAKGHFIARMDADDVCLPHRFAAQLDFLGRSGLDLCGSWFREFGGGAPRAVRWPWKEESLHAAMLFQNHICHPTVMARREVFDQFRYREAYRLSEDYDLFVRAGAIFRLGNVPEVLLHYRRHPQQATALRRQEMELVAQRIRIEALASQGITVSPEEARVHHLIRAPRSIFSEQDLSKIEAWLRKLHQHFNHPEAKRVVAEQWVRACIRAAPLGRRMWRAFRQSPLANSASPSARFDLAVLAAFRLRYSGVTFGALRRVGLSA